MERWLSRSFSSSMRSLRADILQAAASSSQRCRASSAALVCKINSCCQGLRRYYTRLGMHGGDSGFRNEKQLRYMLYKCYIYVIYMLFICYIYVIYMLYIHYIYRGSHSRFGYAEIFISGYKLIEVIFVSIKLVMNV